MHPEIAARTYFYDAICYYFARLFIGSLYLNARIGLKSFHRHILFFYTTTIPSDFLIYREIAGVWKFDYDFEKSVDSNVNAFKL